MAEGVPPGTIAELNEALKNSFAAIKNDMNFLRERITNQENAFSEQMKRIENAVMQKLTSHHQDHKDQIEHINIRMDEMGEKTHADIDFLNEALSAVPQGSAQNDDSVLKAYIEQQMNDLQKQITLVKNNSKEVFLSEQHNEDINQLRSSLENTQSQVASLENEMRTIDEKNKDLNDKVYSVSASQNSSVSQDALRTLKTTIDTIMHHVTELDRRSHHLTNQNENLASVNEDVTQLKSHLQEQIEKISLDVEHKFSNHAVVENKNFQTIKNQLIEFKQELASFQTTCTTLQNQSESFIEAEQFKNLQEQLATVVKSAATKQDTENNQENIRRIVERISRSEEQIRKEVDTYLEQEREARSQQVVTKDQILGMISEAQDVTHGHISQLEKVQREAHITLTEKVEEHLADRAKSEDVEKLREKLNEQLFNIQAEISEVQKDTNALVDDKVDELMQTVVTLQTSLNEFSGGLQTIKSDVEVLQENMAPRDEVQQIHEQSEKKAQTTTKNFTKKIEALTTLVERLSKESATKEYVDTIDTSSLETIDALKEQVNELKAYAREVESQRKDFEKAHSKKIKELQKELDSSSDQLMAHTKVFDRVSKQITDLRSDVSKNYDSSRKLNKLIKKFGQLKEITLSNEVLELESKASVTEGIADQIKSLKKMFKKKPKKASAVAAPTYKSWSNTAIQEMDSDISNSIKKLEKTSNLTDDDVPELLSSVRKFEEKKEEVLKENTKPKGKKKKVGIIAQIGLDQGIITEKDLK